MDETLAKELYQHYGGVPRFVLCFPEANPSKGLDELLEDLHEAVASCDTKQVSSAQGCTGIHAWWACCPLALAHRWAAASGPSPILNSVSSLSNLFPLPCACKQLRMSVGSISTGPDVSHMLLHIVADENFKMQHLVFASKWVAEEFVKKAVHYELQVGPQCPLTC